MRISTGLYKAFLRVENENEWGVLNTDYLTNSTLLFVSGSNINLQMDKEEDTAILGASFPSDYVIINKKVQGSFNFTGHPENLNLLYYLHFGKVLKDNSNKAIIGGLGIFYTGNLQSCLIETDASSLNIKAGAEEAENIILSVDLTINNTIKKVYDYIKNNGSNLNIFIYGYEDANSNFGTISLKIKGQNKSPRTGLLNVYHTSGYSHNISNLVIGEDKKSFSFLQSLGDASNVEAFTGCKAGQLTLDIPNGGLITGTCNLLGKEKNIVDKPTSFIKEKTKPIAAAYVKTYLNGELLGYNNISFDYNPNLFTEVEGGSFYQSEAVHGKKSNLSINITYHYNDISKTKIKQRFEEDEKVELIIVIESNDYIDTNVKYMQIFRFVKCAITESNIDLGGEVINLPTKLDVLEPDDNEFRAVNILVNSNISDLTV